MRETLAVEQIPWKNRERGAVVVGARAEALGVLHGDEAVPRRARRIGVPQHQAEPLFRSVLETRSSRLIVGVALTTAFFLAALPAHALDVGDQAAEFEGKDFFNTDAISLKDLRGRVVLFELFSTT